MTDTVLKTRARWWTAAFLVATFGSAALVAAGVLHGWFGRGLFVASFLLLWPMTRAVNEAQAACGAGSPASRAYGRRMLVASFAYILLFLGGMSVVRATDPSVAASPVTERAIVLTLRMCEMRALARCVSTS